MLHDNYEGYHTLNMIEEKPRSSTVRVDDLLNAIAAARLQARGSDPDIPVSDNRKEMGWAKNRRVELLPLS